MAVCRWFVCDFLAETLIPRPMEVLANGGFRGDSRERFCEVLLAFFFAEEAFFAVRSERMRCFGGSHLRLLEWLLLLLLYRWRSP